MKIAGSMAVAVIWSDLKFSNVKFQYNLAKMFTGLKIVMGQVHFFIVERFADNSFDFAGINQADHLYHIFKGTHGRTNNLLLPGKQGAQIDRGMRSGGRPAAYNFTTDL